MKKRSLFCVVLLVAFAQYGCGVQELPLPDEVVIDVPEGTLLYSIDEFWDTPFYHAGHWGRDSTPDEWRDLAKEQNATPIVVFTRQGSSKEMDLVIFRSGELLTARDVPVEGVADWPYGVSVGGIAVDQVAKTVTYYPIFDESWRETVYFFKWVGGVVLALACLIGGLTALGIWVDPGW